MMILHVPAHHLRRGQEVAFCGPSEHISAGREKVIASQDSCQDTKCGKQQTELEADIRFHIVRKFHGAGISD